MISVFDRVENIVGKEKMLFSEGFFFKVFWLGVTRNKLHLLAIQINPMKQRAGTTLLCDWKFHFGQETVRCTMNIQVLKKKKKKSTALSLSQTSNFRPFQTERIWQF